MQENVENFMTFLKAKNPNEYEFHQAVEQFINIVMPIVEKKKIYRDYKILERMVEPERVIIFRVPWIDDNANVQINTGYRVQMNSALGPYKGGLRFHPTVNLSILKFLAFEQTFKNSLTTLPLGGGKGGSDFNPVGKTDSEIMRFCQAYMNELFRHIGPDTDIPAGDIGVGPREIGYLFGQYKKLKNEFTGVFTGKGIKWGGSLIRPEATGYGVIYFLEEMLKENNDNIENKIIAISGFGQVAWGAAKKAAELGAKVVTLSGPDGFIYDSDGVKDEKINFMLSMRASGRDKVKDYAEKFNVEFYEGKRPWSVKCDIAFPCAIQNELDKSDAQELIKNGCKYIVEGANMPCTTEAINLFINNKIYYAPGKAANAGGVTVSCLEMSQNSLHFNWTKEEIDDRLKIIMKSIHNQCVRWGKEKDYINYVKGSNISGFIKVADAMIDQGLV